MDSIMALGRWPSRVCGGGSVSSVFSLASSSPLQIIRLSVGAPAPISYNSEPWLSITHFFRDREPIGGTRYMSPVFCRPWAMAGESFSRLWLAAQRGPAVADSVRGGAVGGCGANPMLALAGPGLIPGGSRAGPWRVQGRALVLDRVDTFNLIFI